MTARTPLPFPMPDWPGPVLRAIAVLEGKGFECYAVGGCVRDAALGEQPHDWDLTTSALPEDGLLWQEAQGQMCCGLWYDEACETWSLPPVSEPVKQDMDRWELVYPAAVLAAY